MAHICDDYDEEITYKYKHQKLHVMNIQQFKVAKNEGIMQQEDDEQGMNSWMREMKRRMTEVQRSQLKNRSWITTCITSSLKMMSGKDRVWRGRSSDGRRLNKEQVARLTFFIIMISLQASF